MIQKSLSSSSQLSLNFQLRDDATLESFYSEDNEQAFHALVSMSQGQGEPYLYLWGMAGVGKSHLLQAACQQAASLSIASVYIPLQEHAALSPSLLQDLEKISLVCLDDVQCIAGNSAWEEAIFHLYNNLRARQQAKLLVTAEYSPQQVPIQLPDLKSRLAWGIPYQLHPLSDDQKIAALCLRAKNRGLELDYSVGRFLLSRCARNMHDLFHTLEALDQASLQAQRRLTIPFVKQVLWEN